eukprot:SAG31_NODE_12343_length_948_cov_2.697291_1_plen_203_part_00
MADYAGGLGFGQLQHGRSSISGQIGSPIHEAASTLVSGCRGEEVRVERGGVCSRWPFLCHASPLSAWGGNVSSSSLHVNLDSSGGLLNLVRWVFVFLKIRSAQPAGAGVHVRVRVRHHGHSDAGSKLAHIPDYWHVRRSRTQSQRRKSVRWDCGMNVIRVTASSEARSDCGYTNARAEPDRHRHHEQRRERHQLGLERARGP